MRPRRLLNPRLLVLILGAVVLVVVAAVAIRWLTTRQAGVNITPKLIISQSERGGLVLQAMDLSGATKPLQLAPLASLDLSYLSVDRGAYQDTSRQLYQQRWTSSQAHISADGRYSLLAVKEANAWTLLRFDLNNGEPLEFWRDAQGIAVMVHAAGPRFVAQTTTRRGKNLYIGDLAAGSLTALIEGAEEASIRPDATWQHVVYASRSGNDSAYYVAGMDGRQSRAVAAATVASPVSDDGSYVYYAADDTLYRRSMDGGLPERLVTGRGGALYVYGLNPQRNRLLVLATGGGATDLFLLRSDGSERVSLARDARSLKGAAFSADGQRLLVWTNESDGDSLLVFDGQGQNQRAVFRGAQSSQVQWLADNRLLYATQERGGLTAVYVETADGKSPKRLAEGLQRLDQVASDPSGHLAYAVTKDGKTSLYVLRARADQPQLVDEGSGRIASLWLAPGSRVVYQADDGGRSSIYIADGDGKNRRSLADNATIVSANLYR